MKLSAVVLQQIKTDRTGHNPLGCVRMSVLVQFDK